jgi:anti-sigma factor RsiW
VSCDPVRVTGWVDGALPEADRSAMEAHAASCAACAAQAEAERAIARALRALPPPALPRGLSDRVRARARRPAALRRRVWVPALAAILAVALWVRGAPAFIALEASLDHAHCFGRPRVPAQIFTSDPLRLAAFYGKDGWDVPLVPASAGGLDLVGGRYCVFADRRVAHVYYADREHHLSLYVVPGYVRGDGPFAWQRGSTRVEIIRVAGSRVALVSDHAPSLDAFRRSFARTTADASLPAAPLFAMTGRPLIW